jgi:phosphoribosylaminoimidazole-succinocarboxamide synthase
VEPTRRGKVRDVYDLGDRLLLVASDRISAFDWILEPAIPDKGRVLTQLSNFWFSRLDTPNHLLETDIHRIELPAGLNPEVMAGRAVVVKKCEVVPFECVVRGYLVGSGWKDYQATGQVCGLDLPAGLPCAAKLPEPLFTPATKAETGHDENVSFSTLVSALGIDVANELQRRSVAIYEQGRDYAATRGIIIADTKLEWGWYEGELILIDEVLTPDSSRFWPGDQYQVGSNPPSYDKQFVRDYLETTTWDKNSPPPRLPEEIVQHTRLKYIEAAERLMGQPFGWR